MRHNKVKIVWSIVAILLLVLVASLVYISISDTMEQKQIEEDGEALGFDFEELEVKAYEYPEEFEMTEDLQGVLCNLVLYYEQYNDEQLFNSSWEEYFITHFLLNERYSFSYLDKISKENENKISKEEAEYMQYSLTGKKLTFSSDESNSIDRNNSNSFEDASYAKFISYEANEDGEYVKGVAHLYTQLSVVYDEETGKSSYFPIDEDVEFTFKKNPYSCFDGYSLVEIHTVTGDAQDIVNADDSEDTKSETVIENESDDSSVSSETNDKNESDVSYDNSEINSERESSDSFGPITKEEYDTFKKTCNDTIDTNKMQNIKELMTKDYTGTWYDPENGEAIRLSSEGAYVYIPYLDYYGDTLYQWELVDRSAQGACPMLQIYLWGPDTPGLAYYVAGYNEKYFYGKLQGYIFYKQ